MIEKKLYVEVQRATKANIFWQKCQNRWPRRNVYIASQDMLAADSGGLTSYDMPAFIASLRGI